MSERAPYTIDDVVEACIRSELRHNFTVSMVRFYLHMAYALGMGLQPTDQHAALAELDRVKEIHIA